MRACLLLLVLAGACSGAASSVSVSTSASASASGSLHVTDSLDEAPTEKAPEDVDTHLHETPSYVADTDKLYVEITSDGDHAELLHKSATNGLGSTPYVIEVPDGDGGDLELHMEVAALAAAPDATSCKVKIFMLRLPQHDLLAIADGGASATGRNPGDQCLAATSTAIVRDKLPAFFQRRLEAKQ